MTDKLLGTRPTLTIIDDIWEEKTMQITNPSKRMEKLARQVGKLGPGPERDKKTAQFIKLVAERLKLEQKR